MTLSLFRKGTVWDCVLLAIVLSVTTAARGQTDTRGTGSAPADTSDDETPLVAPPPVSIGSYSMTFTSETESNILQLGATTTWTYSSNVTGGTTPVADSSFSFWPNIAVDRTSERSHYSLAYSPGLTVYQNTSNLNQGSQNVDLRGQYRLTPYVSVALSEVYNRSSNVLNQPNPLTAVEVASSVPNSLQAVVPPVADQASNNTNAQVTYQCGETCIIGAGGGYNRFSFTNPAQSVGLYDSSGSTASAFYSRRLRDRYFLGASYVYQGYSSYPSNSHTMGNAHTDTQLAFGFVTIYFTRTLSLSFAAGPQHVVTTQAPFGEVSSWTPMIMTSLGWQGSRTSLSASYSRSVSGAGGLNGTFQTNSGAISGRWQISRLWSAGLSGSYSVFNNLTPWFAYSSPGGHTIVGTVAFQRTLTERLTAQAGFSWVQQSYSAPYVSYPSTSRVFVSVSYHFSRPLK